MRSKRRDQTGRRAGQWILLLTVSAVGGGLIAQGHEPPQHRVDPSAEQAAGFVDAASEPQGAWMLVEDLGYRDGSSGIQAIDPFSGDVSQIAETRQDFITDIALTPGGDLYGIDIHGIFFPNSAFFRIERKSGRVRMIRSELPVSANALAANKRGKLFLATVEGDLYRITGRDGTLSYVGPYGRGLGSSGDLAFSPTGRRLYATARWTSSSDVLLRVNHRNGLARVVGSIGYPEVYALGFGPDGKLYGVAYGNSPSPVTVRINTRTGRGRLVSQLRGVESTGGMASRVVLSPVTGRLRVTKTDNPECRNHNSRWTLCQHQTGFHRAGGGISASDETYAWDLNLAENGDEGRPVLSVAAGRVVRYAGQVAPGGESGAVLVEHPSPSGTWWSGYLHLQNIRVIEGQEVSETTVLGYVGATSPFPIPPHLHFVVYEGSNQPGELRSVDSAFFKR